MTKTLEMKSAETMLTCADAALSFEGDGAQMFQEKWTSAGGTEIVGPVFQVTEHDDGITLHMPHCDLRVRFEQGPPTRTG